MKLSSDHFNLIKPMSLQIWLLFCFVYHPRNFWPKHKKVQKKARRKISIEENSFSPRWKFFFKHTQLRPNDSHENVKSEWGKMWRKISVFEFSSLQCFEGLFTLKIFTFSFLFLSFSGGGKKENLWRNFLSESLDERFTCHDRLTTTDRWAAENANVFEMKSLGEEIEKLSFAVASAYACQFSDHSLIFLMY